jgi:hypothetical protein
MAAQWLEHTVQKARTNALISGLSNVTFYSDDLLSQIKGSEWLTPGKAKVRARSSSVCVLHP